MIPVKPQAIQLFHEGTLALSIMETNGIKVDEDFLNTAINDTKIDMALIEEGLYATEVWSNWKRRFGGSAKLSKRRQLAAVLYEDMKYQRLTKTASGLDAMDEKALSSINDPFIKPFLEREKLGKVLNTYLLGIKREMCGGFLRPSFNLAGGNSDEDAKGGPRSMRSSCQLTNFQNYPIRNPEMAEIIRPCFIARSMDYQIVEKDFSQLEVRIAEAYHYDPTMMQYIKDPTTDMHRDTAMDLFGLEQWQVSHDARHTSKNRFVFPQFYGSMYTDCAENIWEEILRNPKMRLLQKEDNPKEPTGISIRKHLKSQGVTRRGNILKDSPPESGTFAHKVYQVEKSFWKERFPVYTQWKQDWYKQYLNKGYFWMHTGFCCQGEYRRNQVINYPIQGSAFHCLLWCIIQIQKILKKRKMKTKLIGQIHDSLLADVYKKELKVYDEICHQVMTIDLPKYYTWINVPIEIESEVAPMGGSWHEKCKVK